MIIFDFLLIILCSILTYLSYKKIIFDKNSSIANYIILIVYVFCVLPILLNYVIGIPTYQVIYWYKPFLSGMLNSKIAILYDCWICLSISLLYIYSKKYSKTNTKVLDKVNNISYKNFINNKFISTLLILSPFILIIFSGNISNYLSYHNSTAVRGFSENISNSLISPLILLSLFVFFSNYYHEKITVKKLAISFIYFFLIIWISGKRFILANILLILIFYITKSNINLKSRKKLFVCVPILVIFLIAFSGLYLKFIRPLSNTSSISIYEMLRVDFGRDDVIKYVMNEEIINKRMILNYRFESFLSLFLFFVPRKIWLTKPYPHYNYLTSSILRLPISELPAGTTPSWYEMCLANFGIAGILISCILLVFFCKIADKVKDIDLKMLYMILIVVLLTQSMDAYIIYIFILFFIKFIQKIFKGKRIKLVWGKR